MINVENKFLFVLNPVSGGIEKEYFKEEIKLCCTENNIQFAIIETSGHEDHERIEAKIESFEPSVVAACGGDGTVNLVAQMLLGRGIPLGIFPLGSANGLATELEIDNNVEENIQLLLNGKLIEIDVLKINDKYICIHLADIGFNAKLIQAFESSEWRGQLSYAWNFAKIIAQKEAMRCRIKASGREFEQKAEMVIFANGSIFGTGAIFNPKGELDDQRFEVCIFEPYPRWRLPELTLHFFTGRLNQSDFVSIFSTREVEIDLSPAQALQVDGEIIGECAKVTVQLHPEQLPVIVPKHYKELSDI